MRKVLRTPLVDFPPLKLCHCWCDFPLSIWWDNPPSYHDVTLLSGGTICMTSHWGSGGKKTTKFLQCMILYMFSKLCCLLGVGFWWAIFQVELLASHSWQNCFQDSAPEQYHLLLMHSPSPFSILQHCLSTILKHISLIKKNLIWVLQFTNSVLSVPGTRTSKYATLVMPCQRNFWLCCFEDSFLLLCGPSPA